MTMPLLTAVLVLAFFVVLAAALVAISGVLRAIGGTPTSYLARLRVGLRAIENETAHLTPGVTRLNEGLTEVAAGLTEIDRQLAATAEAAGRQERYR